MHITPTGQSLYHEGNQVGRYGLDMDTNETVFIWYHSGLRGNDEPTWSMETDVEWKISVSVDTIFVVDDEAGLFAIDRKALSYDENIIEIDGRTQYLAQASSHFVKSLPQDPTEVLSGNLWIESGNEVDEGYHKEAGEA